MKNISKKVNFSYRNLIKIIPLLFLTVSISSCKVREKDIVHFIYTSDPHFGTTIPEFRGNVNVSAKIVNQAMVEKMNTLPTLKFSNDDGVNAGKIISSVDYLIITGDIANREEKGIQNAKKSWNEFVETYLNGITLKNKSGEKTQFLLLPGNHDVSNAIGHFKINAPIDNTSMVEIYNYMFPNSPKNSATFNYKTDKIHYSKDIQGIHFAFINIWLDSEERIWLENDLKSVSSSTPVLLFVHDQPEVESKHFTNPNGNHDINSIDKFENLLVDEFKDGKNIKDESVIEQREFVDFLKLHKNIKVYFHGNDNENRYFEYQGPDKDINLKIIQVDSPMKGNFSRTNEKLLSFQFVSINTKMKIITVRECLWNTDLENPNSPIVFGKSTTFSLK